MAALGTISAQTVLLTNGTLFRADATGTNLASSGGVVNHGGWTTVLDQQNVPNNYGGELFLTTIASPGEGNFLSPATSLSLTLAPGVRTFYFWADGDDLAGGTAAFGLNLYLNNAGTQAPSISAYVAPGAGKTVNPDSSGICTAGFDFQCVHGAGRLSFAAGNTIVTLSDFKILAVGGPALNTNCVDLVDSTNTAPFAFPAHPDGICDTYGQFTLTVSNSALPDLVFGDIWTTGILAINTANQSANYQANFFGDSGAPVPLPFGGGPAGTLSGTLAPLGSAYSEASAPQSSFQQGWGQVAADPSIVVHALFRDHQPGGAYYEAAVPSNPGAKEFLAPFDFTLSTADQPAITTGFAIANLEQAEATVLCTARDAAGIGLPNNAVQIPLLSPQAHWTSSHFPVLAGLRGTLDCISNTNIAALAVRYFGLATFSSLPVVNNPAATNSNPVVALPDLVVGDIWTNNLDQQTAVVTCTARDSNGKVIPSAVQVPALNPLGHWAGFNFPALSGLRGTVDCASTTNIAALAVRYFGPSTFSTLPVILK